MGHDPNREEPFFFTKPADAVFPSGGTMPYPSRTSDLHHEIELVVALKAGGSDVSAAKALDLVYGYCVGVDLTRRDLQNVAKKMQRPWDLSKGFDRSAPVSPISPAAKVGHPAKGAIWLKINGADRQTGDLADMIWNVPDTIAYLSQFVALAPGDLIFTGTPEGVGPVNRGDRLHGHVDGLADLTFTVA
jgi:fumarylpyruvate hydrolase